MPAENDALIAQNHKDGCVRMGLRIH